MDFSNDKEMIDTNALFVTGFRDNGLTGEYVKTCLEDLARDQMRTETDVTKLAQRVWLVGGATVLSLGIGILLVKVNKAVMVNMQQLSGAVLTTQQAIGLVPGEQPSQPTPQKEQPVQAESDGVDVGATGYDPGPQDIPPHVRKAIEDTPLPADPHDDGTIR